MTTKPIWVLCASLAATFSLSGCGTGEGPLLNERLAQPQTRPAADPARPVLILGGRAIGREAVWAQLAEYGGADVVREIVLDHAVAEELARLGLGVTEADVEVELSRLASRLAPGASEDEAAEISRTVLENRGLGPERLRGLLTRNAGLRKLVADEGEATPEMVELAYRVRYGPRKEARILTVRTAREAQEASDRIRGRAAEIGMLAAFAETAVTRSTDNAAALGGSLGTISAEDPGLEVAVRSALADARAMELSPIVALDRGFALLLVEREVAAEGVTLESVYAALEQDVRERRERLMMETRARELLEAAEPSVLDGALRWSWERRGSLGER